MCADWVQGELAWRFYGYVRHWFPVTTPVASQEAPMANKDKGGKSSKKVAQKSLKEKRAAKKARKTQHTNHDNTFGR